MRTFEDIVEEIMELPGEQIDILGAIINNHRRELRREEIARGARQALDEYRQGICPSRSAEEAISYLRSTQHEAP